MKTFRIQSDKFDVTGRQGQSVQDQQMSRRVKRKNTVPLDGLSTNLNVSREIQALGWSTASQTSAIDVDNDFLTFQDITGGSANLIRDYITPYTLIQDTFDNAGTPIDISAADGEGLDLSLNITYAHPNLTARDTDGHDGPDYPYLVLGDSQAAGKAAQYTRNTQGVNPTYIGRSVFIETALNVDTINDENGNARYDVSGRSFVGGAYTLTDATDSTSKDTGAFILTGGGLGVEKNIWAGGTIFADTAFEMKARGNNAWSITTASFDVTGQARLLGDSGNSGFSATAGSAIMGGANIDVKLQPGAAGTIQYQGDTGLSTFGHTMGGFTDEAAFEAGVINIINNILAGHGLI